MAPSRLLNPLKRGTHHLYLYAKSHYQQGNVHADLQTILGKRAGIEPKHIHSNDILVILLDEVADIFQRQPNNPYRLRDFVLRLRTDIPQRPLHSKAQDIDSIFIQHCLSVLSIVKVREGTRILARIGKADPSILPLNRDDVAA